MTKHFAVKSLSGTPTGYAEPAVRIQVGHLWNLPETKKYAEPVVIAIRRSGGTNHVVVIVAEAKLGASDPSPIVITSSPVNYPKKVEMCRIGNVTTKEGFAKRDYDARHVTVILRQKKTLRSSTTTTRRADPVQSPPGPGRIVARGAAEIQCGCREYRGDAGSWRR